MIHDVIESLRALYMEQAKAHNALRLTVAIMETYLARVSDYPGPGLTRVSRETEALHEQPPLF